jgi:hypothetical protein
MEENEEEEVRKYSKFEILQLFQQFVLKNSCQIPEQ